MGARLRGDEIRQEVVEKCTRVCCGSSGPTDTAAYTHTWEIDAICTMR